jgi:hypothetical protein
MIRPGGLQLVVPHLFAFPSFSFIGWVAKEYVTPPILSTTRGALRGLTPESEVTMSATAGGITLSLVHHEGWMVSDHETIFHCIPVQLTNRGG